MSILPSCWAVKVKGVWVLGQQGLPSTVITLGSLIESKDDPAQARLNPQQLTTSAMQDDGLFSVVEDEAWKQLIDEAHGSTASWDLGTYAGAGIDHSASGHRYTSATKRVEYTLSNYEEAFEIFARGEDKRVRSWSKKREEIWFVVGIQVIYDPSIELGDKAKKDVSGHATLPIGEIFGAYLPGMSGITDPKVNVNLTNDRNVLEAYQAKGARIYSIKLCKVPKRWLQILDPPRPSSSCSCFGGVGAAPVAVPNKRTMSDIASNGGAEESAPSKWSDVDETEPYWAAQVFKNTLSYPEIISGLAAHAAPVIQGCSEKWRGFPRAKVERAKTNDEQVRIVWEWFDLYNRTGMLASEFKDILARLSMTSVRSVTGSHASNRTDQLKVLLKDVDGASAGDGMPHYWAEQVFRPGKSYEEIVQALAPSADEIVERFTHQWKRFPSDIRSSSNTGEEMIYACWHWFDKYNAAGQLAEDTCRILLETTAGKDLVRSTSVEGHNESDVAT